MWSMKGLSLRVDIDYSNCLLSENIKLGPEDLKKIGAKTFIFALTVESVWRLYF